MVVVATAPRPTSNTPSLPRAGATSDGGVTIGHYIIPAAPESSADKDEMRMFLRKSRVQRDPLAVTMSGVRLGEKTLQIGAGDIRVMALIAARTGLTGRSVIVVLNDDSAARVRRAIDDLGALAEVVVADHGAPPDDVAFDAIVVHDVQHTIASSLSAVRSRWLQQSYRALRGGGRIVTIEAGSPVGFRRWFGGAKTDDRGASEDALRSAGFSSVRVLGDREGLRFVEGFKKPD